jgi:hypothetical protein
VLDLRFLLKPYYSQSRALIIGIDAYENATPLSYAVNDANEFRNVIVDDLGFPVGNVNLLLDGEATKDAILREFLQYTKDSIDIDERILVFYAGHGHTRSGVRGEVGYLVPYDADLDDPSTLIRWDDFTRNAELVRAKHMLFIMDACYGGLALKRSLGPGATRFLNDMLLRYTRQVLTAGKADEVVADSGGPIPNHSVFTGHLINGLRGEAATEQGIITANGLMAYVHSKVAYDQNSDQTPHYGYFDGDGDFILYNPIEGGSDDRKDIDNLIVIPATQDEDEQGVQAKVNKVKALLSVDASTIELHDYLVKEVKSFLSKSSEDNFATEGSFSKEEFLERLNRYEEIATDLAALLVCVSHWGGDAHHQIMQKILSRATDRLESQGGLVVWINLRWYPLILVMYYAGISAIAGGRYDSLTRMFQTPVASSEYGDKEEPFFKAVTDAMLELIRTDAFKQIPDNERNYVPMNEYLFKLLQPLLDDILFTGRSYEGVFDEFEIILALVVADERKQEGHDVWGPIGRFGWKYHARDGGPLARIIEIATKQANEWAPLRAGLFGGDSERFLSVADEYKKLVARLNWW